MCLYIVMDVKIDVKIGIPLSGNGMIRRLALA